ncbi:FAD-dependent oxidoreductase [Thermomonas sp. HDW16]|uniref:NAD(P)/FAD-dependent oxidoreductase n=1 Tax=Thermomonas sp. HDW16 TaxID=2714945 RepID=UPI00140AE1BB|nr:FAD-dependent oxidoreductase [Thermomonas sp. HDW16]QIL21147.1 FAD-dependent oxidoreductase [Thermomonas sp. HDW16]
MGSPADTGASVTLRENDGGFDVLVVGAGVAGLATALALIKDGRSVTVIDAGRIGGGASHGNCGTLTPSHAPPLAAPGTILRAMKWMLTPDAPLYIPPRFDPALWRWLAGFAMRCNERDWIASTRAKSALLNDSRQRIADWVRDDGLQCEFVESGEDYVFHDPRAMEHEMRELPLLREFGIGAEIIDGPAYEAQEPALKPGVSGAIRFAGDAALRPDRYVAELARVVRERGGTIIEHCALQSLRSDANGIRAITAQGEIRANDAVIAAGAWSPTMARAIGLPWLRKAIQPGKGYSMTYSAPAVVPKRPLTLREVSVCVTAWGSGFRLGSTMEFSGYDTTLNESRLGALERGARKYLHHPIGPELRERWFGWRPMSRDDIPLIGRAPGHKHLWLATGHGMMGVGMSAGGGQMLADLIAGRASAVDPAPFAPERFA